MLDFKNKHLETCKIRHCAWYMRTANYEHTRADKRLPLRLTCPQCLKPLKHDEEDKEKENHRLALHDNLHQLKGIGNNSQARMVLSVHVKLQHACNG